MPQTIPVSRRAVLPITGRLMPCTQQTGAWQQMPKPPRCPGLPPNRAGRCWFPALLTSPATLPDHSQGLRLGATAADLGTVLAHGTGAPRQAW